MSFFHRPLNIMYLFAILFSLICIQLVSITATGITMISLFWFSLSIYLLIIDSNDVSPNHQLNLLLQPETILDNEDISNSNSESDERNDNSRRSTSFLRFGRRIPPSGSFLRFGRSNPSFLRFGRNSQNAAPFLRFGRRAQPSPTSNLFRFSRKGEFLRFG
jgi:hypothetical protein